MRWSSSNGRRSTTLWKRRWTTWRTRGTSWSLYPSSTPDMNHEIVYVLVIIGVALAFDFINGFHDSANSIATVVSTRVLSPGAAVVWAAFFNFAAAFVVGTAVAKTIGKGLIDPHV